MTDAERHALDLDPEFQAILNRERLAVIIEDQPEPPAYRLSRKGSEILRRWQAARLDPMRESA